MYTIGSLEYAIIEESPFAGLGPQAPLLQKTSKLGSRNRRIADTCSICWREVLLVQVELLDGAVIPPPNIIPTNIPPLREDIATHAVHSFPQKAYSPSMVARQHPCLLVLLFAKRFFQALAVEPVVAVHIDEKAI